MYRNAPSARLGRKPRGHLENLAHDHGGYAEPRRDPPQDDGDRPAPQQPPLGSIESLRRQVHVASVAIHQTAARSSSEQIQEGGTQQGGYFHDEECLPQWHPPLVCVHPSASIKKSPETGTGTPASSTRIMRNPASTPCWSRNPCSATRTSSPPSVSIPSM